MANRAEVMQQTLRTLVGNTPDLGRDRQLFLSPIGTDMTLVAIVDAHATPATIAMHLLALARDLPGRIGASL